MSKLSFVIGNNNAFFVLKMFNGAKVFSSFFKN